MPNQHPQHLIRQLRLALIVLLLSLSACRPAGQSQPTTNLKIAIREDGLYRLTAKELQAAGFTYDSLDSSQLSLTQAGQPVPLHIEDDSLIFYGQAPTSRYTAERPYILRSGEAGSPMPTQPMPAIDAPALASITRTLHLEENYEYASEIPTEENDSHDSDGPWFWQTIRDNFQLTFDLPAVAGGSGQIALNLYGTTHNPNVENDHSLALWLNNTQRASIIWEGQTYHTSATALPAGSLRQGENSLALRNIPEDYLDFSNLNWINLAYAAPPIAQDDVIDFAGARGAVTLSGFSSAPLIFNITDPAGPTLVTGWQADDNSIRLSVDETMHIAAVGPQGYRSPAALTPLRSGGWQTPNHQADLIILTTDELAPGLADLVAAREAQGLTVALVPVGDIYDEFGYGEASPQSLQSFLRYAYDNWAEPRPRYVLLVGQATSDYRGYLATRPENPVTPPQNSVPPLMVPVSFSGETVSDNRLVDINDDLYPEMAVGRWPAGTLAEVRDLVARTLAYEQGPAPERALFTADGTSTEFTTLNERLIQSSQFPAGQATLLNGPQASEVAQQWNQGAWLVTYTGHGSLELWGKEDVFSVAAVSQLTQTNTPPIVLQLTCLSGLFAHPETRSLSETLLLSPHGPVLTIGASSLTYSSDQEPFASALLTALQDPALTRIGDAFLQAKLVLDVSGSVGAREVSDTFTLFGDPSALILRPN